MKNYAMENSQKKRRKSTDDITGKRDHLAGVPVTSMAEER